MGMYIRPGYRKKNGKRHAYWYLVESYRTASGPRQRTVAYLGDLDEAGRLGIKALAEGTQESETGLFPSPLPRHVEVDHGLVRVENIRDFGGDWLGLELMRRLGLDGFLRQVLPIGRETIGWDAMVKLLVLCRLIDPSSELFIAEHLYARSGLEYLLGVPASAVDDNRLYRALDQVLPYKEALETPTSRPDWGPCSTCTTTWCCMTSHRPISRVRRKVIPRPSAATHGTTGPTASRCASAWW